MQTFAYVAMDADGRKRKGVIEAASKEAAINMVSQQGRYILEIAEGGGSIAEKAAPVTAGRRVSRSDLALLTRRLADMSDAGLPLDRVLKVASEQSENARLTEILTETHRDVQGGLSVSAALSKHPKVFDEIYTQTLKAGEASGQFPQVTSRLADFMEKDVARRSQIASAMIYPGILTGVAVSAVVFLMSFVVPKLMPVFKGMDLPSYTRMLFAVSAFLTNNWMLVIGALVGGAIALKGYFATEAGMLARDRMLLQLPLIGPVTKKAVVSRYSRILSTLIFGGVPILEALQIAGYSSGNRVFLKSSQEVQNDVRDGRALGESLKDSGVFPPVLVEMVAIGEETGELPKMLTRVSDSLDFEVDNGLRRLTSAVEPLIVVAMGLIVGFIILSILMPIMQAQDQIR